MRDTVISDELKSMLNEQDPPRVIDVRRKADRQSESSMIPGAIWKDPENVETWSNELRGQEVVIYCVRGGSVSKSTLENSTSTTLKRDILRAGSKPGRNRANQYPNRAAT